MIYRVRTKKNVMFLLLGVTSALLLTPLSSWAEEKRTTTDVIYDPPATLKASGHSMISRDKAREDATATMITDACNSKPPTIPPLENSVWRLTGPAMVTNDGLKDEKGNVKLQLTYSHETSSLHIGHFSTATWADIKKITCSWVCESGPKIIIVGPKTSTDQGQLYTSPDGDGRVAVERGTLLEQDEDLELQGLMPGQPEEADLEAGIDSIIQTEADIATLTSE